MYLVFGIWYLAYLLFDESELVIVLTFIATLYSALIAKC